ncbi:MAG: phosphatase PAP2 family protein [Candidatus Omnitrophota bacterium]|nr:phosphatase PAP2 family protein [Candidatus Omnitrophota bacterium]
MDPRALAVVFITLTLYMGARLGYFSKVVSFAKSFSLRPYRTILIAVPLCVIAVTFIDTVLLQYIQVQEGSFLRKMTSWGQLLNKNVEAWLGVILIFFTGRLLSHKGIEQASFGAFVSMALAGLTSHLMKFIFLRARPYSGVGPYAFFRMEGITENAHAFQSLPSGDVTLVGAAACFVFLTIKTWYLRCLLLLLPFAVALERVYADKHWPSDTVASVGIGFLVAAIVRDYFASGSTSRT